MNTNFKTCIILLSLLSILICILGCSKGLNVEDDMNIRVGYKGNTGYQNYFVALENNIFEKHGVEVEGITFQSTNQMMQALVLGHIDATGAGSIEVIASTEINSPNILKMYLTLVFHENNAFFSLLVKKDSDIIELVDLKGKKIGTLPGTTSDMMLKTCLRNFFDIEDLEIIQLEPRLQLQALSTGQVDALYTVDPIVTLGLINDISKILMKGPENKYMFNPMATGAGVISSDFIKRKPKTTKKFIDAMNEAIDYMRNNEVETRKIIAKATNLDSSVANQMDLIGYWKLEETDYDLVQKYLDFLYNGKIITKSLISRGLYLDAEFIK